MERARGVRASLLLAEGQRQETGGSTEGQGSRKCLQRDLTVASQHHPPHGATLIPTAAGLCVGRRVDVLHPKGSRDAGGDIPAPGRVGKARGRRGGAGGEWPGRRRCRRGVQPIPKGEGEGEGGTRDTSGERHNSLGSTRSRGRTEAAVVRCHGPLSLLFFTEAPSGT